VDVGFTGKDDLPDHLFVLEKQRVWKKNETARMKIFGSV
jgi:hypothetical protein